MITRMYHYYYNLISSFCYIRHDPRSVILKQRQFINGTRIYLAN